MLLDIITFMVILNARNDIAARQFLKELTLKPIASEEDCVSDYQKTVVVRAVGLAGPGAKEWVGGVFGF